MAGISDLQTDVTAIKTALDAEAAVIAGIGTTVGAAVTDITSLQQQISTLQGSGNITPDQLDPIHASLQQIAVSLGVQTATLQNSASSLQNVLPAPAPAPAPEPNPAPTPAA